MKIKVRTKLLKRDYNEELEEIAESKGFEKDAQNLLLSMLYKLDGAYSDYQIVKREVPEKEKFMQNILHIVKKYCKEIKIARPNSILEKQLEASRCKILEETESNEEHKVIFFPNEKVVLYSIIKAGIKKIDPNLSLEEKAILTAIQIGKCISYSEAIRDFNGFSWSILKKEIESIECNVIYIDLCYLLGENTVSKFNSSNIQKLKKSISEEMYDEIKKVAMKFYLSYDNVQKQALEEKIIENKQKLKEMQKQAEFVENISNQKKKIFYRIKEIDEILNEPRLLRKEYVQINKELPDEEKIFSVSHYEEKLQKDREELIKKIEKFTELQNPMQYVKIKSEIEKIINDYAELDKVNLVHLQTTFLQTFEEKIKNINDKNEIIDYIYEIRYLKFLPINKKEKMKDRVNFEEIEKNAISKAIQLEVITPISNNKDTDHALLKSIFDTKSISLEDLYILLKVEDGKLKSEIYDGDMLDSTNYIELQRKSTVQIRKTKKVKIFTI